MTNEVEFSPEPEEWVPTSLRMGGKDEKKPRYQGLCIRDGKACMFHRSTTRLFDILETVPESDTARIVGVDMDASLRIGHTLLYLWQGERWVRFRGE